MCCIGGLRGRQCVLGIACGHWRNRDVLCTCQGSPRPRRGPTESRGVKSYTRRRSRRRFPPSRISKRMTTMSTALLGTFSLVSTVRSSYITRVNAAATASSPSTLCYGSAYTASQVVRDSGWAKLNKHAYGASVAMGSRVASNATAPAQSAWKP